MKQDKELVRSLSQGFNVGNWLEAEQELISRRGEVRPTGSVTVEEYSNLVKPKISPQHARKRLTDMVKIGIAESQKWRNGVNGCRMVYILKPKKDWPKK